MIITDNLEENKIEWTKTQLLLGYNENFWPELFHEIFGASVYKMLEDWVRSQKIENYEFYKVIDKQKSAYNFWEISEYQLIHLHRLSDNRKWW